MFYCSTIALKIGVGFFSVFFDRNFELHVSFIAKYPTSHCRSQIFPRSAHTFLLFKPPDFSTCSNPIILSYNDVSHNRLAFTHDYITHIANAITHITIFFKCKNVREILMSQNSDKSFSRFVYTRLLLTGYSINGSVRFYRMGVGRTQ